MKIPLRMDALTLFTFSTSPSLNYKTQGREKMRSSQQVEDSRLGHFVYHSLAKSVAVKPVSACLSAVNPVGRRLVKASRVDSAQLCC